MLIWSQRRGPRMQEQVADAATAVWLALWISLGIRLYGALAQLAGAGHLIQDAGHGLGNGGDSVADAVNGLPLVGEQAASGIRSAFGSTASNIVHFGSDLERLLLIMALLLGLIVVAIAVIPWLNRYLPWRINRFQNLNAARRVIHRGMNRARGGERREIEALLAARALYRLDYDELLDFTPDPLGDYQAGRFDRLIQAELRGVGLISTR
ncbi:MAG TPA: hypothetical protein VF153_04870 [Candidatus Limnocylindria bacterium]